jgi:hypothetical protein
VGLRRLRIADVLARLRAEGLATADADDAVRAALPAASEDYIPWYIRLAVGFGAWAATAFLLGFFFALAGLEDPTVRLIFGGVLLGAAVWVRRTTKAEFMRQSAVAASIAAQGLILSSISDKTHSTILTCIAAVVLSAGLVKLMPDAVHRFLSGAIGAGAVLAGAMSVNTSGAIDVATLALVAVTAVVWRVRLRDRSEVTGEMLEPVGYALIVTLFVALLVSAFMDLSHGARQTHRSFVIVSTGALLGPITTLGITAALAALVWRIIDEHGAAHDSAKSFAALAGAVALGAGALHNPGIVAGATALVLGFDRRNSVLIGMAVVFLLVFGSVFYYSLNLTLLEKSAVLVGSGALLLAIRRAVVPRDEGGGDATEAPAL